LNGSGDGSLAWTEQKLGWRGVLAAISSDIAGCRGRSDPPDPKRAAHVSPRIEAIGGTALAYFVLDPGIMRNRLPATAHR